MMHIWMMIILLHVDIGILICNDASTKIKSQDINITNNDGYTFNTGSPISAVYTGNESTNYAIVTFSNVVMIRGFGSFGSSTTGTARVYYI